MSAADAVTEARRVVLRRGDALVAYERADRRFADAARHLWDNLDDLAGDALTDARLAVWVACQAWADARREYLRWDCLLTAAVDALARLPHPEGIAA
jgi:hypothetical protein